MNSRRRPALAVKRRNRALKGASKEQGLVGRDDDTAGLNAVNVKVGPVVIDELIEPVGDLLSAQFLRLANLADSASNDRNLRSHPSRLSELDRLVNELSPPDLQVRDSVGPMPSPTHDLTLEECEAWMRDLGLDWKQLVKEAGIGASQQYIVKSRWGENPKQAAQVREALERLERKRKERTPSGETIFAIEEWNRIGLTFAQMPEILHAEIERLRPKANGVTTIVAARKQIEEASSALGSTTPAPTKPRK